MSFWKLVQAVVEGNLLGVILFIEALAALFAAAALAKPQSREWVLDWLRSARGTAL